MRRTLHPKMLARSQAVKRAHAHLKQTVPGFHTLHPHDRIRLVHRHIGSSARGPRRKDGI